MASTTTPSTEPSGDITEVVGEDINPRDVLPKDCPTWCASGPADHLQAFHEIGGPDRILHASVHMSGDMGHRLNTLVQPYTGDILREGGGHWTVEVRAQGGHERYETPFVHLEVSLKDHSAVSLQLTSGEARKLIRQLRHTADLIDLEP